MRNFRYLRCLLTRIARKPNAAGQAVLRVLTIGILLLACSAATHGQKPELVIQTGHSGWIHTVAFSPDGRILASGSSDQTIKLWNAATGAELRTLRGHTYSVLSVAFDSSGTVLASGGGDNTVRLWDPLTGKLRQTLTGHSGPVTSVVFSPDGRTLASGSVDGLIRLWSLSSGRELRSLANVIEPPLPGQLHPPNVNSIAFSPDGKLLLSGGIEHTVKLWDVNTGTLIHNLKDPSYSPNTVAFSGDGQTILSASDNEITLWDVRNGNESRRLKTSAGRIDSFTLSPDGLTVAAANYSGKITLLDLKSGAARTLSGHASEVLSVAFSPDGKTLVSGSSDRTIKLWDLGSGVVVRTLEGHSGAVFTNQYSGAGKMILAGSTDRTVKLWELSSRNALLRTIAPHVAEFLSLTFSPDGKFFVTSGAQDPVRIWEVSTGTEVHQLPWLSRRSDVPVPKAFSPDGKILAGEDNEQHIQLYDVASGVKLRELEFPNSGVGSIAFSPDGKILAAGGFKEVKLWDVASAKELHTLADHANIVHAIVFSPDSQTLVTDSMNELFVWDVATGTKLHTLKGGDGENFTFSPDGKTIWGRNLKFIDKVMTAGITQWDAGSGAELRTFTGHTSADCNIAFSPDAKAIATGSRDNTISLWDLDTGKELRTLTGHSGQVLSVAFSTDGKLLISSSDDLTIKIWDAASGQELATLIALDDQDWTVITPDGLFDGSPGAWDRIGWTYPEQPFEVTPVEAYFTEFYDPGLLADIMAGKRPKASATLEDKDRRQIPVKLTREEKLDPQTPVASRTVRLQIEIEEAPLIGGSQERRWPASGAGDVRLFRNGSLVKFWQGDLFDPNWWDMQAGETKKLLTEKEGCVLQPRRQVLDPGRSPFDPRRSICTVTVPIVADVNNFTAYAFNRDNIKSRDAKLVINGAESLQRQGIAYVLAVGVNSYSNSQYDLKYAVPDAEDFSAEIKRQQETLKNYARVEVVPLYDKDATKANILQALSGLAEKAQPEDAVVVYFSGHGTAQQQRFYLIPYDLGYQGPRTKLSATDLQNILHHSISDRELEDAFAKIDAGQMLMVIDACNSGQALDSEEKRRGPMNSKGLAQLAYEKGMYILTAAQSYQAAWEASKLGHGYLTYALIEKGLKLGAADDEPKDGAVTLREWLNYATDQVPRMQQEKMKETGAIKDRQGKSLELVFLEGDENIKDPAQRNVQRPRVFYRREPDARPLVVAKVATAR